MCMKADHAVLSLSSSSSPSSSSSSSSSVRYVDVEFVRKCIEEKADDFIIVDVRELDELEEPETKKIEGSLHYPLGPLLRDAAGDELKYGLKKKKRIILLCNIGYRGSIAAQQLSSFGLSCYCLEGGAIAFHSPMSAWYKPDYVVVLESEHEERATLAASVATASQVGGRRTALVLMGSAPLLFRKKEIKNKNVKHHTEVKIGEPFQPLANVVKKFIEAGGKVFGCKSCVVHHGLDYGKMEEFVNPLQSPDLVRMTCSAQGSTSFA